MCRTHRSVLFVLFLLFAADVFADEIHLKDGRIIKGKILQVADKQIRYEAEQGKPAAEIGAEGVLKVVYDDGRILIINPVPLYDVIHLYDNTTLTGRVVRITDKYIAYNPPDADFIQVLDRSLAVKIVYRDGRIVDLVQEAEKKKEGDAKKRRNEKDKSGAGEFTIGASLEFLRWDPVFARYNNQDYFRLGNRFSIPALKQYGLSASYRGERWGFDANFLYGKFRKHDIGDITVEIAPQVNGYDRRIASYQASFLLTCSPNKFIRILFGPRYEGVVNRDRGLSIMQSTVILPGPIVSYSYLPIPLERTTAFHSAGPELGVSLHAPLFLGLYLSPRLSGLFFYGKETEFGANGKKHIFTRAGIDSGLFLGWKPESGGLCLEAGAKYRYLHYLHNGNSACMRNWDRQYGFTLAAKYAF